MKIEIIGRNVPIDDRVRSFSEQKLRKLAKFLEEPAEARITLHQERHLHVAELHVTHRLGTLQATEQSDGTLLDAIHLAVEKLESQARRAREKLVGKKRRIDRRGDPDAQRWPVEVLEEDSVRGGAPRIIESTHLAIKPMTIEEAALQLDDSAEGFVVFRDSANDRINVLYRRKDQNYGLIAPE
jgi:putative sigma-54 modulation protein